MKPHAICEDCLEKQRRIDQLLDENSQVWPKAIPGMDEKASMKVMRLESSMWVWMRLAPTVAARWKIRASVTGRY